MNHVGSSFLCGYAAQTGHLFVAKEQDENADAGVTRSNFFVMNGDKWGIFPETAPWIAQSIASLEAPAGDKKLIVGLGPHGQVWQCVVKPSVATLGELPAAKSRFLARRLSAIDNSLFAVGMSRRVFTRTYDTGWTECSPTDDVPGDIAIGFNDLVGMHVEDLYAVGWRGEIYRRVNGRWRAIDSPVSSHLRSAFMTDSGDVYAVGYDGIMVRGSEDTWSQIETGRRENLQDVCEFDGTVFACSDFRILRLESSGLVADDRFLDQSDVPATCLHLVPSPQGLYSIGPKDLFIFRDGVWRRIV